MVKIMANPNSTIRVAIYARVSTASQNIKQQITVLRKYCKKRNYSVLKVFGDIESGTLFTRKDFQKLLNETKCFKLYHKIIIMDIDRLTRNFYDAAKIEKHFRDIWHYCKLESPYEQIDLSNANGRAMFRAKIVFSALMVEAGRERQKIGIDRARKEKKYKGRKPGSKNKPK